MTYDNYLNLFCGVLQRHIVNRLPKNRWEDFVVIFKEAEQKAKREMDEEQLPILLRGKRNAQKTVQKMKNGQL